MKYKYLGERFDGPWFNFGGETIAPSGKVICEKENFLAEERFRELFDFCSDMAIAWSESDNEAFSKFYYGDTAPESEKGT